MNIQFAKSKAGHDKNQLYFILKEEEEFVYLVNGTTRPVSYTHLNEQLVEAKKELFNLRFQNATNQLDNTSRIKEVRRNIARIQTVIAEQAKEA